MERDTITIEWKEGKDLQRHSSKLEAFLSPAMSEETYAKLRKVLFDALEEENANRRNE